MLMMQLSSSLALKASCHITIRLMVMLQPCMCQWCISISIIAQYSCQSPITTCCLWLWCCIRQVHHLEFKLKYTSHLFNNIVTITKERHSSVEIQAVMYLIKSFSKCLMTGAKANKVVIYLIVTAITNTVQ